MSQDQNPQNIYRPLIINQAYQGMNTKVEPINQYGAQINQYNPNQQYQPQIQQYQPQQGQYETPQQYPQPYYIMDPNIIQGFDLFQILVDPLPQSDKIKDQTEIEQASFLTKLTAANLIQQFTQIVFCTITIFNRNICENFYNFETQSYNFVVYLCFFLLIGIIIVAKLTQLGKDKTMAFFMFLSFFIIFDVFACAFVSGCSQSIFESNAPFLVYISLLFYLEAPITFLTFSIITIYLLIDKKRPKIHKYFGYIVAIQFAIYIIGSFSFNISFLLNTLYFAVISIIFSSPFTLFYLYNMNCIIKGSGNLNKDQFMLAAILVYFPY